MQPDQEEIETRALSVPVEAKGIMVVDDESFQRAGKVLLVIKELRLQINTTFDPVIASTHAAHKEAVAAKKKVEAPLVEAEGIIKPRLSAYHDEQERKRREEEERLREEAYRKADEDKLRDAVSAEQSGMPDLADAIMDGPAYVPTVVAPSKAVKLDGVSFRDSWKAEVYDLKALCKAVVEGKVPANVVEPAMTVLNGLARSLRGQLNYPGVRAVCEKITSGGRR